MTLPTFTSLERFKMAISFCAATYNRFPLLKKLLKSIRDGIGNYPYEIVIADGGSTDGTLEYLRKQEDVKLIEIGKPSGSIKALNKSFKKAKYEYITFPNDDMELVPEVIIKCCNLLDKYPEVAMVSPKMIESTRSNFPNIGIWKNRLIISKLHIIRSDIFKKIGFLSEKFKTYYVDADSTLDVLNLGHVTLFSREVGAIHFRVHDTTRKVNVSDDVAVKKESDLYEQKWRELETKLHSSFLQNKKNFLFWSLQNKMRESHIMKKLMEKDQPFAINLFDWVLQRCVIFEAKEYTHFKDFYLAQKIPEEVLKKRN